MSAALTPETAATIAAALREGRGRELAGLLVRDAGHVQTFLRAPNLADEPGCVDVPGWWIERVRRWVAHAGGRLEAFVHSHVSALELGPEDRAGLAALPLPWIVVRLAGGGVEACTFTARGRAPARGPVTRRRTTRSPGPPSSPRSAPAGSSPR